jgi:hypothetical protein
MKIKQLRAESKKLQEAIDFKRQKKLVSTVKILRKCKSKLKIELHNLQKSKSSQGNYLKISQLQNSLEKIQKIASSKNLNKFVNYNS